MLSNTDLSQWLQMQNLIPQLLSYLSSGHSPATQTSAGDFLKAIITISANATTQDQNVIGPNELTRQLVSEPCIQVLIKDMLRGGNPLTVGVGIIIEVIRKNNSDYDLENQIGPLPKTSDPIYLGTLLRQFAKHIPDFMDLVLNVSNSTTNSEGTTVIRKRELKSAWGEKIEPLGFDRFKTCELMAELLHCSNMALLNERGAEAEVKKRDHERERLKAEGKLGLSKEEPSATDFGTSVDSAGFHHAQAPSIGDDSPEELRRLDVSNNAEEEDFEKVNTSDALAEEIQDEIDEKLELMGEPLERSPKVSPRLAPLDATAKSDPPEYAAEKPRPLSPTKRSAGAAKSVALPPPLDPAHSHETADSPTSAGVTEKVSGLDLDQDIQMTSDEPIAHPSKDDDDDDEAALNDSIEPPQKDGTSLVEHPEDKPPPLFARKSHDAVPSQPGSENEQSLAEVQVHEVSPTLQPLAEEAQPEDTQGQEQHHESFAPQYEVDNDGSPVVGDLLKVQFVEHKVVPTILVRIASVLIPRRSRNC